MEVNHITKSDRLLNYIIDIIIVNIIYGFTSLILTSLNWKFLLYIILFSYYLISEALFQRTIGKLVTNTYVVTKYDDKPKFILILMRSFLRTIPVDQLSYLFGSEQGLHNRLSFTRLVKK